ncbi:MAG: NADH-quinone oxidoreductase subunit H, partial [Methylococcaceae bacterium]|nr:NADH-quinone oxidoreductase subunit H [Methylococcaceae bacterium]
ARFFLALAGLDIGTAFGGMGSSREMTISSLAEPAMLMAIFTLTMTASTTNLSVAIAHVLNDGMVLRPSFVFALLGLILVAIAETGRVPVDNPATHLELTMIHEAMILEYSGRHLALIEWASQLKLMLYGVLIANIFFPWGIAESFTGKAIGYGLLAIMGKLALLAILLAVAETLVAKMRLFRVQEFLGFAYLLGLLGMLSHIILEASR